MAQFDLPEDQLRLYRSSQEVLPDFDEFWHDTLTESRALGRDPVLTKIDGPVRIIDVYDLTFSGYEGQPIRGWLKVPRELKDRVPVIVQYIGYGGGRGWPIENLHWLAGGAAHLVMEARAGISAESW